MRLVLLSFLDVHFYLVCLGEIFRLLYRSIEIERDGKLQDQWNIVKDLLGPFREARNHLEHVDERVEIHGADLGVFTGNAWQFAGKEYERDGNLLGGIL